MEITQQIAKKVFINLDVDESEGVSKEKFANAFKNRNEEVHHHI